MYPSDTVHLVIDTGGKKPTFKTGTVRRVDSETLIVESGGRLYKIDAETQSVKRQVSFSDTWQHHGYLIARPMHAGTRNALA